MEPIQNIIRESNYKMEGKISRVPHAVFCALITVSVVLTGIIIGADLVPALKNWLKETFFHHWIGKGVIAVIVFVISFLVSLFFPPTEKRERLMLMISVWVLAIAVLAIAAFFAYEAFRH